MKSTRDELTERDVTRRRNFHVLCHNELRGGVECAQALFCSLAMAWTRLTAAPLEILFCV